MAEKSVVIKIVFTDLLDELDNCLKGGDLTERKKIQRQDKDNLLIN